MHSLMFAIWSMLLTTVLSATKPWLCFKSMNACYLVTDDVSSVKRKFPTNGCRNDNPNLSHMTTSFLDEFIAPLCGCEYCSFEPKTYPTSAIAAPAGPEDSGEEEGDMEFRVYDETANTARPLDGVDNDMEWMIVAYLNMLDISNFIPINVWTHTNYTISVCSKAFDKMTGSATCTAYLHCAAAKPCPAKEKEAKRLASFTAKSSEKKSSEAKGLLGLLFIPGFLVGICAAYGFYRYRRSKQSNREHVKKEQRTHLQQNVPVQQTMQDSPNVQYIQNGHRANGPNYQQNHVDNVPHAVTQPQMA